MRAGCTELASGSAGPPSSSLALASSSLKLQFQLVEQLVAALGRLPKPLALQYFLDLQPKLFIPRRMSVWPTASQTRTPDRTGIIAPTML